MMTESKAEIRSAYALANLADCATPDTPTSAGAAFLLGVQQTVRDDYERDDLNDDTAHEIADAAVPTYTGDLWRTFVDLAAYQEDPTELGVEDGSDMDQAARVCLYMIAERLASALIEEIREADDDEAGDDEAGDE